MENDTFKKYFIYCQEGNQNNIEKIEKNSIVKKIEKKEENLMNGRIYIIYCLEVASDYKEKPFTLIMIDGALNTYYKDIYPGTYKYDILFNPLEKKEITPLNQIALSVMEQFNIFKNFIKKDGPEAFNKLISESIEYSSRIAPNSYYNFILLLFSEMYDKYKLSPDIFKEAIIKYFKELKFYLFDQKKSKNDKFSKPNIDDNLKHLDIFSNIHEIRNELISITKEEKEKNAKIDVKADEKKEVKIDLKIDVFLGFYCIHFKPKSFINFVDITNENFEDIKSHLKSQKKLFNRFNSEIINFELLDEAESLDQIQSILLNFIPNRLELFKVLADKRLYSKLTFLSQIEQSKIKLCKIQKKDDIKKISNYFFDIMKLRKMEYYLPIVIDEAFFVDYCKLYSKKNCENIRIIKNMLEKYNEMYKRKINIGIDEYYHETGIHLIEKNELVNYDMLTFLNNDPYFKGEKNKIKNNLIDLICQGIVFNKNDKRFVNDFFNNKIDEIDLKKLFGYYYNKIMENIFKVFQKPKDLLSIKNLVFEEPVHEDLVELFLKAIKDIWLRNPKNNMFDEKKLIGDVFRLASKKFGFFEEIIDELEINISNSLLLPIYSEILYRKYDYSSDFKKHIIKYIESHNENNAISIWYHFTTLSNEEEKFEYLKKNLDEKYAVQMDDFVPYPEKKTERIILFTSLINAKVFIKNKNLRQLGYYKKSIESKSNILNLKYKDANSFYKDEEKNKALQSLLFNFFVGPDDELFINDLIDFSEKCGKGKHLFDSLKNLLKFWKTFFKKEKKNSIAELDKLIKQFENIPLNKLENFKNEKCSNFSNDFEKQIKKYN